MQAINYSEARNKLRAVLDSVIDEEETFIITGKGGRNAVILSLEEYNGMIETMHLLSSPANAERLRRAIRDVDEGRTLVRELID